MAQYPVALDKLEETMPSTQAFIDKFKDKLEEEIAARTGTIENDSSTREEYLEAMDVRVEAFDARAEARYGRSGEASGQHEHGHEAAGDVRHGPVNGGSEAARGLVTSLVWS